MSGEVGERIKEIRIKSGLSQDEVASAAGISRVQLSNIERGVCSTKIKTLEKICSVLKIGIDGIVK